MFWLLVQLKNDARALTHTNVLHITLLLHLPLQDRQYTVLVVAAVATAAAYYGAARSS